MAKILQSLVFGIYCALAFALVATYSSGLELTDAIILIPAAALMIAGTIIKFTVSRGT